MHPSLASLTTSPRLRADVALYAAADGPVLRVGDTHHDVHLAPGEVDVLLDALLRGHEPTDPRARDALASLVEAGLADPAPACVAVIGDGVLATALRAALIRMGAVADPGGAPVRALDEELPSDVTGRACWVSGRYVVLSPPAVPAPDVVARHRAATRHRDTDGRLSPVSGGRGVRSALSPLTGAGLELAASAVAAELLRPDPAPHAAVMVDLVALTVSHHPVLPVPPAPR
jgi:hypothetical protein